MKHRSSFTRLTALALALLLALSLAPAALAAGTMGNFKKIREYPGFSDVPADKWYANDVRQAYELGLMGGKGNGKFDPEGNLTLAEAITMACQVHATYFGLTFTPGGSPWYQNAIAYALEYGIIDEGEYSDYTAKAARVDLASLFYCIPTDEFPRINRIAWISDLTDDVPNWGFIYLLYSAGVLTGSATGAFQPNNPVTRAEAAAIINRVVLPENRVHTSVTTNAPGQVVTSANGNFKISMPLNQGWEVVQNEVDEDGWCFFACQKETGDDFAQLLIMTAPKKDLPDVTMSSFFEICCASEEDEGAQISEDDVYHLLNHGMRYTYVHYVDGGGLDCEMYCTENSSQFYRVWLVTPDDYASDLYGEMKDIFSTLDIAL